MSLFSKPGCLSCSMLYEWNVYVYWSPNYIVDSKRYGNPSLISSSLSDLLFSAVFQQSMLAHSTPCFFGIVFYCIILFKYFVLHVITKSLKKRMLVIKQSRLRILVMKWCWLRMLIIIWFWLRMLVIKWFRLKMLVIKWFRLRMLAIKWFRWKMLVTKWLRMLIVK